MFQLVESQPKPQEYRVDLPVFQNDARRLDKYYDTLTKIINLIIFYDTPVARPPQVQGRHRSQRPKATIDQK